MSPPWCLSLPPDDSELPSLLFSVPGLLHQPGPWGPGGWAARILEFWKLGCNRATAWLTPVCVGGGQGQTCQPGAPLGQDPSIRCQRCSSFGPLTSPNGNSSGRLPALPSPGPQSPTPSGLTPSPTLLSFLGQLGRLHGAADPLASQTLREWDPEIPCFEPRGACSSSWPGTHVDQWTG